MPHERVPHLRHLLESGTTQCASATAVGLNFDPHTLQYRRGRRAPELHWWRAFPDRRRSSSLVTELESWNWVTNLTRIVTVDRPRLAAAVVKSSRLGILIDTIRKSYIKLGFDFIGKNTQET